MDNDYNAIYAEYLFRAVGQEHDWLSYHVPGPIESVRVVAFVAQDKTDVSLLVSADGTAFTRLEPARKARRLPSPPGGAAGGRRRTLVEYECRVLAGNRYLKLVWTGPAELDRVEVYHSGRKPIEP